MNSPGRNTATPCVLVHLAIALLAAPMPTSSAPVPDSARQSLAYLRATMDQYHDRFGVYEDVSSAGNHFHAYAMIPSEAATVGLTGSWTNNPHSGATCIRCVFTNWGNTNYGGFYFQAGVMTNGTPLPNFGTAPNAGYDLRGATSVTFWARGQKGGEKVEFFVFGVGRDGVSGSPIAPYPDSSTRRPARGKWSLLSTNWQRLTIDLTGANLSYVLGGFAWVVTATQNFGAVTTFFMDDIQYNLGAPARINRLNRPRLLRSYTTLPRNPSPFDGEADGDLDLVFRNLAFTYDSALALLAFLAEGSPDGTRRAKLIGDALLYALSHDRKYNDNVACGQAVSPLSDNGARLRSAYAAGDISVAPGWTANGRQNTIPAPGFYWDTSGTFWEVEQDNIDAGNNAWAMVALLALYQRTTNQPYLDAACKIGGFLHALRSDTGTYRGFLGGISNPEGAATLRTYASSEHNLDIHAAFRTMYRLTGTPQWQADAEHARLLVEATWNASSNYYRAGTTGPESLNNVSNQLPVDVQAWSVLAISNALALHPSVLASCETNHAVTQAGLTGYDFNNDRDGIWFEGTAQMAVSYLLAGNTAKVAALRSTLRAAQATAPTGDGRGIASANREALSTGFNTGSGAPFKYYRRLHVGATAWNVFAQMGLNPYNMTNPPVTPRARSDFDGDGRADLAVYWPNGGQWTVRQSADATTMDESFGWNAVAPCAGDFDGDGFRDLAVYHPATGSWYIRQSRDGALFEGGAIPFGWSAAYPVAGDYDGDGRTDLAVYWPAGGTWYVRLSSGGTLTQGWGWADAIPVPEDYDGDGKTDIAVYWPTGGRWFIRKSTGGQDVIDWGWSAALPQPADYDGDGKADIAVYHPATGSWYVRSATATMMWGAPISWGWSAAAPVADDYDGDGQADIAVYHQGAGRWYVRRSSDLALMESGPMAWGWSGAGPVLPQVLINRRYFATP